MLFLEELGYNFPIVFEIDETRKWEQPGGKRPVVVEKNLGGEAEEVPSQDGGEENVPMVPGVEIEKLGPNNINNAGDRPIQSHKERSAGEIFGAGLPGLRLSRQIWPGVNKGGRARFGKIKQLARQFVDRENQKHVFGGEIQGEVVEVSQVGSAASVSSPHDTVYPSVGVSSKRRDEGDNPLKNMSGEENAGDVVEIFDSGSNQSTVKKLSGKKTGSKLGDWFNQECCQLKSVEEVEEWVSGIIAPLTNQVGVSSIKGDQAVKSFFLNLGLTKLKERQIKDMNDDEREINNYEQSNAELLGDKLIHV
ncbi:hypothetical protein FRX31_024383 [Thalictrum thalictroides]|uniref:Uncharacterized protein n=1 Tax=Thalictrum thalictroides TaxID=46969 RepID=A0A7J6VPD4_THATH|nr:hypothetical protein FRX31_024383 [Thalictrum thalictroides]